MKLLCKKARILLTFSQSDIEDTLKFAEFEFKMSKDSGSGSLRDQLNLVWKNTGIRPKELDDLPELPKTCIEVWNWFIDLSASRTSNGFGMNPFTYQEILAYFTLINVIPKDWEIKLLKMLDSKAIEILSPKPNKT